MNISIDQVDKHFCKCLHVFILKTVKKCEIPDNHFLECQSKAKNGVHACVSISNYWKMIKWKKTSQHTID